jgi:uncharacterized protein (DUF58 family)
MQPPPRHRLESLLRRPLVVLGLAMAVAVAVFILATPRALPMLGGLVATVAVGLAGPWLSLLGLRGRLGFAAERCRVGDRVACRTRVTRCGRPAQPPRVDWPADGGEELAAGHVTPTRRGLFPRPGCGPVIASDWPFGIVTARRPLAVDRPLVVRPLTAAVRFPAGSVAARRSGRDSSTALPGTAGDIIGVRDYRPGDPARSIHWPQTARRGELVVCERPGGAAARVRILLVGDRDGRAADPAAEARLDAAVAVASSLLESWSARGADLEVAWARPDGTATVFRPRSRQGLDAALDAVACLEPAQLGTGPARHGAEGNRPQSGPDLNRHVDLEICLLAGLDPGQLPSPALTRDAACRLVVAFSPAAIPGAITLPASAAAAAELDRALAAIGHDPDARSSIRRD